MLKNLFYLLAIGCFLFFIFGCDNDEMLPADGCPTPTVTFNSGVFVVNEGAFQNGTGTLSFIDSSNSGVSNQVFQNANCDAIIGNILQSVTQEDNRLYFVVNNAGKVIVTDNEQVDLIGEITGLQMPRRFLKINESTAYISQWENLNEAGSIAVVDLNTYEIEATIPMGNGPEYLIEFEDKIYVSNAGNINRDSTVLIVNPTTNEVEKTLVVGDNPNAFQIDKNGDLWVSCLGYAPNFDFNHPDAIKGQLVRISDETVQEVINLEFLGAQKMEINPAGDLIYFLQGGYTDIPVYAFDIETKVVSSTPFIETTAYGLGVHPTTGHLFIGDAKGFAETGEVSEYDENGNFIDSFFTSIGPNGFVFKE